MIRYRVWDGQKMQRPPDEEYSLFGFFLGMDGSVWSLSAVSGDGGVGIERTDATAMLYTGIEAEDGQMICEGDIITFTQRGGSLRIQAEVKFADGGFYLLTGIGQSFRVWEAEDDAKVVGNIYE